MRKLEQKGMAGEGGGLWWRRVVRSDMAGSMSGPGREERRSMRNGTEEGGNGEEARSVAERSLMASLKWLASVRRRITALISASSSEVKVAVVMEEKGRRRRRES